MLYCLVTCTIWIGNFGYNDHCTVGVKVVHETLGYYYVKVVETPISKVFIEYSESYQVKKEQCGAKGKE